LYFEIYVQKFHKICFCYAHLPINFSSRMAFWGIMAQDRFGQFRERKTKEERPTARDMTPGKN
jgi:hypothetical protein